MKISYIVFSVCAELIMAQGVVNYADDGERKAFGRRCAEWLESGYRITTQKWDA